MARLTGRIDETVIPRIDAVHAALQSPTRTPRWAVVVGRLIGVVALVVFLTGLWSHVLQDPPTGWSLPTRPVALYQWTQGLHVVLGSALLPLILVKLWVVYPRLFEWPPVTSAANGVERLSVALLVSTSLLQPVTGLVNTYQWYPWPFPFKETHYALGWIMIGALALHVAVKLPVIRSHWRRIEEHR